LPRRLTDADYRRAAKEAGVPYNLLLALLGQEGGTDSKGNFRTSSKGARGPGQLMPGTARALEQRYKGLNTSTPYGNLLGGALYLREQKDRFKHWDLALAAYNAGPGAVEEYGGIPPYAETQRYVRNILAKAGVIKGTEGAKPKGGGGSGVPSSPAAPSLSGPSLPDFTRNDVALQGLQDIAEGDWSPARGLQGLIDADKAAAAATQTPVSAEGFSAPQGMSIPAQQGNKKAPKGGWVVIPKPAGQWPAPGQAIVSFAQQIAMQAGRQLTAWDTSTHSRTTVNGNVSAHTTGDAMDIPAKGAMLLRLGRIALMQAGMPRRQAMRVKGGLFNIGGRQIIFNTQQGGDHTDHLHIANHRG
jgi:hypothetical protein